MPSLASIAADEIKQLEQTHRLRRITPVTREGVYIHKGEKKLLSFASNDYFGLAQHPEVKEGAIRATEQYGAGSGASRLVTGNYPLYEQLEDELAAYKGTEAACIFGSGYLANLGVIQTLVGAKDLVLCDKLSHACIYDGIVNSGALWKRFKHNNLNHLAFMLRKEGGNHRHRLIVTESVFGMDGDTAPQQGITKLAHKYDAWVLVDDAHGLGIAPHHPEVDLVIGTLSKGLGSYGGYVAGSKNVIAWLKTKARSLIYSTALPPSALGASLAALNVLRREPHRIEGVMHSTRRFCEAMGLPQPDAPIVPFIVGSEAEALSTAQRLEAQGILAPCIRPPTVPPGTARLRLSFSYNHATEHIDQLTEVLHNAAHPGIRDAA